MKVLLHGGGSREHALAWKLSLSPLLEKLYLCCPNDGFKHMGEVLETKDTKELAIEAKELGIELLVVGPEAPLMEGIVDEFNKVNIPAIGPNKQWAMLEGSKTFAKEFMSRNKIPTAKYSTISSRIEIETALSDVAYPLVLKADGLAAGKGVVIVESKQEAFQVIDEFLNGKYGQASKKILVEEFLAGEELSLIALWDGKTLLPFIAARDYKKLLEGNKGPNTGGMGSYCPVKLSPSVQNDVFTYIKNLEAAFQKENAAFTGIIYSGLMLTSSGIKVLEYNMRFGDPETQPLMMHLDSDLLYLFDMATKQKLDQVKIDWKQGTSFCIVIAAKGYPENPAKGGLVENIEEVQEKYGVKIFFAGIKQKEGSYYANGGRVLSICKSDLDPKESVVAAAKDLLYTDKQFRSDIGS